METTEIINMLKVMDNEQFKSIERAVQSILEPCSVRLKNAIRNAGGLRGFCTDYLFSNTSNLLRVRNFGKKSLSELMPFIPQIKEAICCVINSEIGNVNNTNDVEQPNIIDMPNPEPELIIQTLTKDQIEILGRYYAEICSTQSIRVQNVLRNIEIEKFITKFIDKKEDVKKLEKIGRKSEIEIKKIIDLINEKVNAFTSEYQDYKSYIIQKELLEYKDFLDDFAVDYLKMSGHVPMLYILDKVFYKYANTIRGDIAIHLIGVMSLSKVLTRAQIADKYDYSYERVRQISKDLAKSLLDFSFKNKPKSVLQSEYKILVNAYTDWEYIYDQLSNKIIITEYDLDDLLREEKSALHRRFVLNIIRNVFKAKYDSIQSFDGEDDGLAIKPFYLVDRKITEVFDFDLFFQHFNDLIENSYSDIEFSIQELVYQNFTDCWKIFSPENIKSIESVLTRIFIEDYNLMPNENQRFIIEARKTLHVSDVIYQILYEYGEPMSIQDIYTEVSEIFPNKYDKADKLRPVIMHDGRISSVGRGSTFALKEWAHVKFGSIRDLIVEFLNQFSEPKHISDISAYVTKYASTTEKNIRSTMGSGDQFVVFENGYYGLSDKLYDDKYIIFEERKSFDIRITEFETFLIKEDHFPFASSDNPDEESLNHWWKRTIIENLNPDQKEKFISILTKYESLPKDKRTYRWFYKCNQYIDFLKGHKHKPSIRKKDEYELAEWFSKASRDFNDCKLTIEQEKRFVELCKYL